MKIRFAKPQLKDRRLRLIHSGRLLADDTQLFTWLSALDEKHHTTNPDAVDGAQAPPTTVWLHCSVGPQLEPGEEDETKVQVRRVGSFAPRAVPDTATIRKPN